MPLIYLLNGEFTKIGNRGSIGELVRKCIDSNRYLDYLELNDPNYDQELVHRYIQDIYFLRADNQIHYTCNVKYLRLFCKRLRFI